MAATTIALLVADGRFPAGAHAHSSGLEAAVAAGRVTDLATLDEYLRGRLTTAGLVAAAFAAAARQAAGLPPRSDGVHDRRLTLAQLDAELDARTASPAQRAVSRRQGRALLRAGREIWPAATFDDLPATPGGPHQPLALGLVGAAAGLDAAQVATVAVHATVTGSASAAVRLLGLDPYQVQALLVRLADACDATATRAARAAELPPRRLPAAAAPLADIHAEAHATWEVRLFAS
ncbi:urease accessory protein UreF [Micromonospora maris]|uniref:Urease accessory protein UreF n=1 Tax=Micromonospora maris TaxID=1003110 RepID=A0A9X0LCE7_9ACTN|nr:urease accessory UreF family protein [Micromonospora maris]AEB45608.1 urease accessory protein [Micromonospora maris AB-18-032]KUJ44965.1 urease accessory protein UreF [Micromonospora maris]